jgi:hypothetical protein
LKERSVLFEYTTIGAWARVAAIDEATGVEVVAIGPVGAERSALERLALRKLERALAHPNEGGTAGAGRPGRLV